MTYCRTLFVKSEYRDLAEEVLSTATNVQIAKKSHKTGTEYVITGDHARGICSQISTLVKDNKSRQNIKRKTNQKKQRTDAKYRSLFRV